MPECCPDNSETLSGCYRKQCPDVTEICRERERERESGPSICWVRDTEKISKSNKIKKPKGKRRLNLSA
jgi:hypothetical protein